MNTWLIVASGFGVVVTLVHTFLGGREIVRPLLDAKDIQPVAKYVNYLCWHISTALLAAASAAFAYGAMHTQERVLVMAFAGLCAIAAIAEIGIIIRFRQSFIEMPQWILLGAMAGLAFFGLSVG